MNKHIHQNELKPKEKMSLQDLKGLFPEYEPGKAEVNRATKRGYKHVHGKRKSVNLLGKIRYEVERSKK